MILGCSGTFDLSFKLGWLSQLRGPVEKFAEVADRPFITECDIDKQCKLLTTWVYYTMKRIDPKHQLYPETIAGGFSKVDGTVQFYQRINALFNPDMTVVDIGAGRGQAHVDDSVEYRRGLRNFKGRAAKVIGIDVDEAARNNPSLDEVRIIENGIFPLDDECVDLAFSDFTYEHVPNPEQFASEAYRILKPGAWLCARTPNKYGYIGCAARMVPNSLHTKVLKHAQPGRKAEDIFPTMYLLNTKRDIRRHFPSERWANVVYGWNAEPAYFGSKVLLWRLAQGTMAILPEGLASMLMIFSQKRPTP